MDEASSTRCHCARRQLGGGGLPGRQGRGQVLGAYDREQAQLGRGLAVGRGAEPQQALAAVLAEQAVAVQLDDSQCRVDDALVVGDGGWGVGGTVLTAAMLRQSAEE
jgi:hypothetical protein